MNTDQSQSSSAMPTSQAWSLTPGSVPIPGAVAVQGRPDGEPTHTVADDVEPPFSAAAEAAGTSEPDQRTVALRAERNELTMPDKSIESMSTAECNDRLGEHHFGRLAFVDTVGALPLITPVTYLFDDGTVVFRTDPGSKLTAAIEGAPVAFEVDELDEHARAGWSVVVRGHAQQVTDPADLAHLQRTPLVPWAPGAKPYYVRVHPRHVTGRRITRNTLPSNWWG